MIKEIQLRLLPQDAYSEINTKRRVANEMGISVSDITSLQVLKRSVDARQRTIFINLKVRAFINEEPTSFLNSVMEPVVYREASHDKQVIVVGAGPAGLFAALRLLEGGFKPVIIERGKSVVDRKRDIALISRTRTVDPDSNYCYGEGGAGAFSDGKLFTRSKKKGANQKILVVLCRHGASEDILIDAHPHIGSDKLPRVIANIRNTILDHGGEVHFNTRMTDLIISGDEVKGIVTHTGKEFRGPVILATGHSARDVYRMLYKREVALEQKGIAVGVRLEHPQTLIDCIQYHNTTGRGEYLPAAEYSFVTQVRDRGVYSFCMCPGGFVVPAVDSERQVVVNGMSPSTRGSKWANSGMVVEVRPEDVAGNSSDVLSMLRFQEQLEQDCFIHGGETLAAPSQRMVDFVSSKASSSLPDTSYVPGIVSSPLHQWMPKIVSSRLQQGFRHFGQVSSGFLTNEATMIGVETRTSAPLRIPRDKETLRHIALKGLYPCGEGAGYAGGIISAAIDGERCAESIMGM